MFFDDFEFVSAVVTNVVLLVAFSVFVLAVAQSEQENSQKLRDVTANTNTEKATKQNNISHNC